MKKTDDPYKILVQQNQRLAMGIAIQNGASYGTIISPPPNIIVQYRGMLLNKSYLDIDEYWLQGHERAAKGTIVSATQNRAGGGGDASFASHNHDVNNDYTDSIIYTDTWKKGDKVAMLPIFGDDGRTVERYFIFGKVRRLE